MKKIVSVCLVIIIILALSLFFSPQKLIPKGSEIADMVAMYVITDEGKNEIELSDSNKEEIRSILSELKIKRTTAHSFDKDNTVSIHISTIKNNHIEDMILYVNSTRCWVEGNGIFDWIVIDSNILYEKISLLLGMN